MTCLIKAAIFIAWATSASSVTATEQDIDEHIIRARSELCQALDRWSPEAMMGARAAFERLLGRGGRDWLIRYYIALSDYRLAIYYIAMKERRKMDPYLKEAEEQLRQSIEEKPDFCDSFALLASVLGLKISRNPISGIWIGPRIGGIMEEAKKLQPDNPRMWLIEGIGAYHRPKIFGGGIERAKEALRKSIECFDREDIVDSALPSWGESEVYAWLGIVEMKNNELDSARVHFEKALAINPANGWVSYHLLPELNELSSQRQSDADMLK